MIGSRRRSVRRIQWGLVDQAISSFTNFGITILVARVAAPAEFGAFSLAITLYLFLLWVSRSLTTEPFVVRLTVAPAEEQRAAAVQATGAALAIGGVAGVAMGLIGLVAEPSPHLILGTMAVAMPVLLVQDSFRYVLFAAGRARAAAASDLAWLLVQTALVVVLLRLGHDSASALVAAFGIGAALAALVGARQTALIPSPTSCWQWLRQHRDLGLPFVLELVAVTGALQLAMLAAAASAGLIVIGELRAGMLLLGPLTVVFIGVFAVVLPEAVRIRARSLSSLSTLVVAMGLTMPLATALWAVVVSQLPDRVGSDLLGANWFSGRDLLVPVTVIIAGNACALAAAVGLRALSAAKQSLGARLWGTPVMLVGGVLGSSVAGAYGAAVGLAVASWVDALLAWAAYGRVASRAVRADPAAESTRAADEQELVE